MSGWIKLHRELLTWRWGSSANHLAIFIQLLLRANYKPSEWRSETINPGQILTGRIQLSEWTGLSENQVRTVLRDLEKTGEITRKKTNQYSIITVVNWNRFQEDHQPDNQPATSEPPSSHQPTTTSKKVNNTKKERKNIPGGYGPLLDLFTGQVRDWLMTGEPSIQEELFKTYRDETLLREIQKAYNWTVENQKRKAGTYLTRWLENSRNAQTRISKEEDLSMVAFDFHFETFGEYHEQDPRRTQGDEIPEELR